MLRPPRIKAMRRVAHTIPSVADHSNGYAHSATRLCEGLIGSGVNIELATLEKEGKRSIADFVRIFPRSPGPRKLGASSQMHQWLRRAASAGEIGLLHSHSLWVMPCVYPSWVSQLTWTPYVVSPRGTLADAAFATGSRIKGPFWRFVQRPALYAATCFHATSEPELLDIRRRGFTQPVAVIPNGVDIAPLAKSGGRRPTLLYLGRMHPIKQPDVLIRAWARLEARFPDWDLRMVGPDYDNPGYLDQMRALAQELGATRIRFDGELTGDAKLQAYREADLYVLPTKTENFGITVSEALSAGTPVVVTKGAPWSRVVEKRVGWWIEQGVDPLVDALTEAMSKPRSELAAMGERGHAWMSEEYRWSSVTERMLRFYDWIVSGMPISEQPEWVHLAPRGGGDKSGDASRWTSARKAEVVVRILKGEPLDALSRELNISTARLAEWRDDGLAALRTGLGAGEAPGADA